MKIEEIRQLADIMTSHNLECLELENKDIKICLKKAGVTPSAIAIPYAGAFARQDEPAQSIQEEVSEALSGKIVTSPIVGVFYAAPSPDESPFVSLGSRVSKGDTLCIVEAMKMMNEITSDFDGEVSRILVEDGQMVEFGQPIMTLI